MDDGGVAQSNLVVNMIVLEVESHEVWGRGSEEANELAGKTGCKSEGAERRVLKQRQQEEG